MANQADKNEDSEKMVARMARYLGCSGTHRDSNGRLLPCSSAEELNRISNRAEPKKKSENKKRRKRRSEFQNLRERGVMGIETLPSGGLVSAAISKSVNPPLIGRLGRRIADVDMLDELLEIKAARQARSDRESATPAKPSERISGSSKNPAGSARSSTSGNSIELTATVIAALAEKVASHNKLMREQNKPDHAMTSLGTLKSVWRRGAGAFSSSHRPGKNRQQWAMARVNAFLVILASGKPKNSRYTTDNDLLKTDHPWKKRGSKKSAFIDLDLKAIGRSIGRAREPFDDDAEDGDGDGKVQDGTPWERQAMAKNFFQSLWGQLKDPDGGFTLSLSDLSNKKSGWAIARAGRGIKLRADEIFDEEGNPTDLGITYLAAFLDMNYDQFTEKPVRGKSVTLGAWHNPDDGLIYFDVTDVYDKETTSLEQAREIAAKQNQISMADLDELHAAKADDDWDNHTPFHNTGGNGTDVADPKRFASFVRARQKQQEQYEQQARERVEKRRAARGAVGDGTDRQKLNVLVENVRRRMQNRYGQNFDAKPSGFPVQAHLQRLLDRGYTEDEAVQLVFDKYSNLFSERNRRDQENSTPTRLDYNFGINTQRRLREGPQDAQQIDARRSARERQQQTAQDVTEPQTVTAEDGIEMMMAPGVEELAAMHGTKMDWYAMRAMDKDRRQRLAEIYADAPEPKNTNEMDAEALESFSAMRDEVAEQFRVLTEDLGITVEFVDDDPYPDFFAMRDDFVNNKRLKILKTEATGGHPFFTNEENDMFRAVHDAFGHLATGRGFDRHGEEAAYQAHRTMFGETAQRALASELRAQNVFLLENGDFGPQKAVLMPDEFIKRLIAGLRYKADRKINLRKARSDSDADNAFSKTGSHHVSCGRSLKKGVG